MKIVFACDHGGLELKKYLMDKSKEFGYIIHDSGCYENTSVDYPNIVKKAVVDFREQNADFLVITCGSGVGVSIAANRHHDIRALVTDSPYLAALSRQHNHANCLCMGGRITGEGLALDVFKTFVESQPDMSERHVNRVKILGEM
jgi:ribose 5-phosphate isomerase B